MAMFKSQINHTVTQVLADEGFSIDAQIKCANLFAQA
jgi:hypothetical protein